MKSARVFKIVFLCNMNLLSVEYQMIIKLKMDFDNDILLSKSISLPEIQNYSVDSNPVFACLEDQCQYDIELSEANLTQIKLRDLIVEGLKRKILRYENDFVIWPDTFITELETDMNFYYGSGLEDEVELAIFELASQLLNRKITIHQIDGETIFEPYLSFEAFFCREFHIFKGFSSTEERFFISTVRNPERNIALKIVFFGLYIFVYLLYCVYVLLY